jgi:small-conductance mechanosensitive channel
MSKHVESIRRMLITFIALASMTLVGVYVFDELVAPQIPPDTMILQTSRVLIVLTTTVIAIFFLRRMKKILSQRISTQAASFFEYVMIALIAMMSTFSILRIFQVDTNTLLISGGIISLTIGLIISTFVGDTLAGMLVLLLNLYRVGDIVLVNNIPSVVEEMSALVTRFRNDAGGVISIPNTAIAQGGVVVTKFQRLHDGVLANRLPYAKGDRVYTTYMNAEGVVEALDPIHTRIKLDSGMEIVFMNNSVLLGSVAIARVTKE